jgi:transcriptional regulator with XRE-family HTH domain
MGRAEFADRVDRLLDDKDLDQLAREVNLKDKSAFSHYRTGERAPNLDRLAALCLALDVTADYLLGLTDEMRRISTGAVVFPGTGAPVQWQCPHCGTTLTTTVADA